MFRGSCRANERINFCPHTPSSSAIALGRSSGSYADIVCPPWTTNALIRATGSEPSNVFLYVPRWFWPSHFSRIACVIVGKFELDRTTSQPRSSSALIARPLDQYIGPTRIRKTSSYLRHASPPDSHRPCCAPPRTRNTRKSCAIPSPYCRLPYPPPLMLDLHCCA